MQLVPSSLKKTFSNHILMKSTATPARRRAAGFIRLVLSWFARSARLPAAVALLAVFTVPASAQNIPWTGDATSGIDATSGTLWARHFGSTTAATINGVSIPGINTVPVSIVRR